MPKNYETKMKRKKHLVYIYKLNKKEEKRIETKELKFEMIDFN